MAQGTAAGLRCAGARTAPRRRRAARGRLSPGGTLALPAPRPGGGGVRKHRRGDYRLQHGSRLPDRRRRGARRQLLAPGADAVQRHRAAGTGDPRGFQQERATPLAAAHGPTI